MGRLAAALLCLALLAAGPAAAQQGAGFRNWAAVIVAADFHAHSGAPAETFDNARRDLAAAFVKAGFDPAHVSQLSNRPERYPDTRPVALSAMALNTELTRQADAAKDGCLVYFTSHGSPDGIVFGNQILQPDIMNAMITRACGYRPTVVFVSACFSGVFIGPLSSPNRMVMTAARPDRSSFGCREEDQYTFFDDCVLKAIPTSADMGVLPNTVRACVQKKEAEMRGAYDQEVKGACARLSAGRPDLTAAASSCAQANPAAAALPPSEPQLYVGGQIGPMLAQLKLGAGAPTRASRPAR